MQIQEALISRWSGGCVRLFSHETLTTTDFFDGQVGLGMREGLGIQSVC